MLERERSQSPSRAQRLIPVSYAFGWEINEFLKLRYRGAAKGRFGKALSRKLLLVDELPIPLLDGPYSANAVK